MVEPGPRARRRGCIRSQARASAVPQRVVSHVVAWSGVCQGSGLEKVRTPPCLRGCPPRGVERRGPASRSMTRSERSRPTSSTGRSRRVPPVCRPIAPRAQGPHRAGRAGGRTRRRFRPPPRCRAVVPDRLDRSCVTLHEPEALRLVSPTLKSRFDAVTRSAKSETHCLLDVLATVPVRTLSRPPDQPMTRLPTCAPTPATTANAS